MTLTRGEKEIAESVYVVKGQSCTIKPWGCRTDGSRTVTPGPDFEHATASHGGKSESDSTRS